VVPSLALGDGGNVSFEVIAVVPELVDLLALVEAGFIAGVNWVKNADWILEFLGVNCFIAYRIWAGCIELGKISPTKLSNKLPRQIIAIHVKSHENPLPISLEVLKIGYEIEVVSIRLLRYLNYGHHYTTY
jgi:hypothetical protein